MFIRENNNEKKKEDGLLLLLGGMGGGGHDHLVGGNFADFAGRQRDSLSRRAQQAQFGALRQLL